jgi:hypothetical protein
MIKYNLPSSITKVESGKISEICLWSYSARRKRNAAALLTAEITFSSLYKILLILYKGREGGRGRETHLELE